MTTIQLALREALGILIGSAVLGFGYTALTEQGLFADDASSRTSPAPVTSVITLPDAKSLFDSGDVVFVDSRHEFDFRMGHIQGAVNIPLAEADTRMGMLAGIPRSRTLIVYCDGAECNSSFALAARLRSEGFSDIRVFFGGWNEWQGNNMPSEGP